jgi:hypothetical protein
MDQLNSHPDPTVAQAADDFDVRFRETRELIRAELKDTGEQRTTRRVLDNGDALERAALLIVLGHAKRGVIVVKTSPDDEAARAWDQRACAFLEGLVGDGPLLGAQILRPQRAALDATPNEELAVLNTDDPRATLQQVTDREGWPTCPTT